MLDAAEPDRAGNDRTADDEAASKARAVTRDDVVNAYRFILGREPESEGAIAPHLKHPSVEALRAAFMNTPEFLNTQNAPLAIGRFREQVRQEIEYTCSQDDLDRMLAETSRTWSQFGEETPHWSVMADDRFVPDNIETHIADFNRSGFEHLELSLNSLRRAGLMRYRFDRAMDFGCGVGRLSIPLSRIAGHVTAIDVSPGHLKLARQRAASVEAPNIDFVQLTDLRALETFSDYDFILSLIVLQHNPPPVMAYAFKRLLRALAPGGVAIIQMPTLVSDYFSVTEYLANPTRDMEMHALPQRAILEMIEEEGCRPVEVAEDGFIGGLGLSHQFTILRP